MTKLALGVFPREPTSDSICSKQKQEIEHLEGRSNKLFNWFTGSLPTDNRTNLEWVVSSPAAAQVELTVRAQRAGTLRRTIPWEERNAVIQVIWEVVTSNIRVWSNELCQSKRNLFSGFSVAHLEDVQNHSIICDNYSTILISRASILVSDSEHASRQAGRFFKKGHALHGVVGLSSPHRLSQACEHECTCLSPDLEALTRTENRKRWDREASCVTKNESTWRNAAHGHHKKWFTTFRQRTGRVLYRRGTH